MGSRVDRSKPRRPSATSHRTSPWGLSGASVLIGLWARTQEQAIGAPVVIGIAAGMLGGCVYPLDVVDSTVRSVGHAVPQAWAMDAFIKLIYHHAGFTAVLSEVGALAAFAVVLCALSTRLSIRLIMQGQR